MAGTFGRHTIWPEMKRPLISILMPAYNAEKYIAKAISSVLVQEYSRWELLILNDGSSDSTQAIIESFVDERIRVFHRPTNQGYLDSCNELFKMATGDFITFLDADDSSPKNRLSVCLSAFEKDPTLDFITTDHQRISESDEVISNHSAAVDHARYASDPDYLPTICCATIFVRKELVQKVDGYRPYFKGMGGEDYFWLWELSRSGKGTHISEVLYDYRLHAAQISKNYADELSLFLPELLGQLRSEFLHTDWDDTKAKNIEIVIRNRFCTSNFERNLRKAQRSLNIHDGHFWRHTFRSFPHMRSSAHAHAFLYLLYSWVVRKGRNAGQ